MEALTLTLFCLALASCVLLNFSIVYALIAGFFIFCLYGARKGFSARQLGQMALSGIATVKNILLVFLLIGMLTALWRACGTIPAIVCYFSGWIHPSVFVLMAFLLNCGVSSLTGTAFGTAATMGVICMTMGAAMGVNPILAGGAILSGVFFGDRCSPVSTSALLVSTLTGTDIYANIRKMYLTALVPFALTCAIYALLGLFSGASGATLDVWGLFSKHFSLPLVVLAPAAVILLLSAFKVNVKATMAVSILLAFILCLTVQGMALKEVLLLLIAGYRVDDPLVAPMLNGGGIVSMLRVAAIVCISSSYAGIFKGTGLLERIKRTIAKLSDKITPFGAIVLTATLSSMIACNQTLAIMLTHHVCGETVQEPETLAIDLENSVVVISPLIPWSIACAVPLSAISAPTASLLAACFLYLLPACHLLRRAAHLPRKVAPPAQSPHF
ncbi:MAG: Na+/H+ antiporter NhaC family protein [Clostridia bacterium]